MSTTYDLDYTFYEWYLQECKATGDTPSPKGYNLYVQEMDMDISENYDD